MSVNRSGRRPLGKRAETVVGPSNPDATLARWAAKRTAAKLLLQVREKTANRVSACGLTMFGETASLVLNRTTGRAHFTGLTTCSNVWCCPVCAHKIAMARKDELDRLLSGARAAGLSVSLLTLTLRHTRHMALKPMLSAMKSALRRLRQSKEWRALPVAGSVTATEVTHGANGWHPHFHVLVLSDASSDAALAGLSALSERWLSCLALEGFTGNHAALQVQDGSAAGDYIGKFGAACEVAFGAAKQGRGGSRTPWQLLEDARDGDAVAAAVWREYAAAFAGLKQLSWSRGLKARFLIEETSDEDAAAEPDPEPERTETLRVWTLATWRDARRRRCALIAAAESGGDLAAAEFGPMDGERWRRLRADGDVICDAA